MDEFYNQLAEILDEADVKPEDTLRDFSEWDSLSVLSILAMLDSKYGVNVSSEELATVITASDLASLASSKRK